MCGIVAYTGQGNTLEILLRGLRKLEYRGYDSAGLAVQTSTGTQRLREVGKIAALEAIVPADLMGDCGIAHTRWATHGRPSVQNAHPHQSKDGRFAVVHNGIVENYAALRAELESQGVEFVSETDTECIAHLLSQCDTGDFVDTVRAALKRIEGTYGLAILDAHCPGQIVAARKGSPLVLGVGEEGHVLASDLAAIISYANKAVHLDEGDLLWTDGTRYHILADHHSQVHRAIEDVPADELEVMLGGYSHFMQKEICEQPLSLANTLRGRLVPSEGGAKLQGLESHLRELRRVDRIVLVGCGTSFYASLYGEYLIEELAGLPVEVELASEFRYRNPVLSPDTLVLCVSQSGETADTLAALREAQRKGATVLGLCNGVGSSIARASDGGVYLHAGPEIGVASTKAFTSQVVALALIGLTLGRMRRLSMNEGSRLVEALQLLPERVAETLALDEDVQALAPLVAFRSNVLYLGRGTLYPVALEGALKLKETAYINAQAYSSAELKHGPLALVDEDTLAIVLVPEDHLREKVLSNLREARSRGSKVLCIGSRLDDGFAAHSDALCEVPEIHPLLTGILQTVVLQTLAYHVAVLRGCEVDQPRNLAKSVTVE